MTKKEVGVYTGLFFTMLFWGLSFVWYKQVFIYYGPITTILLRLIISTLFLWIFAFALKEVKGLSRNSFFKLMLTAFFQPFLYFFGESQGVNLVSSTLSSVIIATIPVFTATVGIIFLKEKLKPLNIIGFTVSLTGVFMLILNKNFTLDAPLNGLAFLFLAVLAAVGYSLMIRNLSLSHSPFMIVTYQNLFGIFYFLPFFILWEYNDFKQVGIVSEAMVPMLQLAVFASTLAFIFFTYGVKHIGVAKASIFTNLIPVVTAVSAFFIIKEPIFIKELLGIAIVITGLFISQVRPRKIRV
jgi:drug/metabolite transporter (DMT)-like permease